MAAFNPATCGRECKTLSRVFYDAARLMRLMEPWQAMSFVASMMNQLEADQKLTHTVWGGQDDQFPGTLEDKLEAGANIALNLQAPSGAIGRGRKELIVEIVATNDALGNVDGDSGAVADVTRLSLTTGDDWLTATVSEPTAGRALLVLVHNVAQGAGTTFKFYTGIGEEATITIDDNGHISAVKTAADQANLVGGVSFAMMAAIG